MALHILAWALVRSHLNKSKHSAETSLYDTAFNIRHRRDMHMHIESAVCRQHRGTSPLAVNEWKKNRFRALPHAPRVKGWNVCTHARGSERCGAGRATHIPMMKKRSPPSRARYYVRYQRPCIRRRVLKNVRMDWIKERGYKVWLFRIYK